MTLCDLKKLFTHSELQLRSLLSRHTPMKPFFLREQPLVNFLHQVYRHFKNTFATQIISDVTPDPALVPSNSFRWLLVKTDNGLSLTLPEEYTGTIQHFGQQEKFFVRFDTNTGLPEISFDLQTWQQPYYIQIRGSIPVDQSGNF